MQETGIRLQIGNRPPRKSFNRLDNLFNENRRFRQRRGEDTAPHLSAGRRAGWVLMVG
jgi:hypothetical protein